MNKYLLRLNDVRRHGAWVKLDYVMAAFEADEISTLDFLKRHRIPVKERGGALWVRGLLAERPARPWELKEGDRHAS